MELSGDRHHNGVARLIRRHDSDNAGPDCLHLVIGQSAQCLGLDAIDHLAHERDAIDIFRFGLWTGAAGKCERRLGLAQFLFKPLAFGEQGFHPRRHFVRRGFQKRRDIFQLTFTSSEMLPRRFARQRFDTANAARDGTFGKNCEQCDIAERIDVRSAT